MYGKQFEPRGGDRIIAHGVSRGIKMFNIFSPVGATELLPGGNVSLFIHTLTRIEMLNRRLTFT